MALRMVRYFLIAGEIPNTPPTFNVPWSRASSTHSDR